MTKNKFIAILILSFALQVIQIKRENPDSNGEIETSKEIKDILKKSCFDCHSNKTVWPFYSRFFPFSYIIVKHVQEGRGELNFSEWENLSPKKKRKKVSQIIEEVENKEMPPLSYKIFHPKSTLTLSEITEIKQWSENIEKEFDLKEKSK